MTRREKAAIAVDNIRRQQCSTSGDGITLNRYFDNVAILLNIIVNQLQDIIEK